MAIKLTPMDKEDYESFLAITTLDYAEDKIKNGTWPQENALKLSRAAFAYLLPRQWRTPDNYLRNVELNKEKIGFLWYALMKEHDQVYAFLYEIYIQPLFRNNGYGSQVMELFIGETATLGIDSIELHVFGHNRKVLAFYERLGFQISDYTLKLNR